MEEDFAMLVTLVKRMADASLVQARKIEDLQARVKALENPNAEFAAAHAEYFNPKYEG
ncbi:MAG: hypothetical protein V4621_07730 [Pseudomonadota bacterium]